MFRGFESFVALRYLRSKRKEVFISLITVISVFAVAISVMVLDIVMSVMTGFERELKAKLLDSSSHILITSRLSPQIDNWEDLIEKVTKVEGVVSAYPYTQNQVMLTTSAGSRGLLVRGLSQFTDSKAKLAKYLESGTSIQQLYQSAPVTVTRPDGIVDEVLLPPIIVGRELRKKYGILLQTPVTMLSPDLRASPQGLIPKMKRFVVVGSYSSGLIEYEMGLAYMSLKNAQSFFGLGKSVTGVEVTVTDMMDAQRLAKIIEESLGGPEAGLRVMDWTEPNKPLWDAIKLEKKVYFIVLQLLVLIASFCIVSTLVMVVMEKTRDIAILKTLGASDASILKIFMVQSKIIGFVGVLLGTALGYGGCLALKEYGWDIDQKVFSLDKVPVHMEPMNFLLVAVAGLIITSLAGLYPAFRGSKIRPAEALRYE